MNDYIVDWINEDGLHCQHFMYGCESESEAIVRFIDACGDRAFERMVSIQPFECQSDVKVFIDGDQVPTEPFAALDSFFNRMGIGEDHVDRAAFIRAEVEAMDWPDTIGE